MRRTLYTLLTILGLQLALAAVASASVQLSSPTLVGVRTRARSP